MYWSKIRRSFSSDKANKGIKPFTKNVQSKLNKQKPLLNANKILSNINDAIYSGTVAKQKKSIECDVAKGIRFGIYRLRKWCSAT